MQDVESVEPAREQAPARDEAAVPLAAVTRQVDVVHAGQIGPQLLTKYASNDAVAQIEVLGEHEMLGVDLRVLREGVPQPGRVRQQPENPAVDERHPRRHAPDQSETASSPGTMGRGCGRSPRRAMLPTDARVPANTSSFSVSMAGVGGATRHRQPNNGGPRPPAP